MASSEHGSTKTVEELVEIGAGIGRPAVERTTTTGVLTRNLGDRKFERT
jgi:FO synthase